MIILSISDLSLPITDFLDAKLPRVFVEPLPTVEYSNNGNSIGTGPSFPGKHIWVINASLEPADATILQAIYAEFDYQRQQLANAEITVIDKTKKFVERSPRTKPLAPSTTEETIGSLMVAYYAQFSAWMTKPPELQESGVLINASFTLQEV